MPAEPGPGAVWTPAVDIYETADEFILTAELPGVESSGIDIKVVDNNLLLRGERRWDREANRESFQRVESGYGKFERSFRLSGGIDAGGITAELELGVLRVTLPKRRSTGYQIPVKTD